MHNQTSNVQSGPLSHDGAMTRARDHHSEIARTTVQPHNTDSFDHMDLSNFDFDSFLHDSQASNNLPPFTLPTDDLSLTSYNANRNPTSSEGRSHQMTQKPNRSSPIGVSRPSQGGQSLQLHRPQSTARPSPHSQPRYQISPSSMSTSTSSVS
jgi:hypothetical protein